MVLRCGLCAILGVAIGALLAYEYFPRYQTPVALGNNMQNVAFRSCDGRVRAAIEAHDRELMAQERVEEDDHLYSMNDHDFIRYVYLRMFNREPDPGGWENWEDWLKRGASRGWIVWKQFNSEEFLERHPLTSNATSRK